MELDRYEPRIEWFRHNAFGIHGIVHVTRVLVWADRLGRCLLEEGLAVDLEVVRWAAVLHDVGRLDDGRDTRHGERSAQWVAANRAAVCAGLGDTALSVVQYCCTWHVQSDSAAPAMSNELACLKDADGLERVRLSDLNAAYLRTAHARRLIPDAQRLFLATRAPAPAGPWQQVRQAAMAHGWWR